MEGIVKHSNDVEFYANMIAQILNVNYIDLSILSMASKYHDCGKINIPKCILDKPGKLTKDEFEVIKKHTQFSKEIFLKEENNYLFKSICSSIILYHHENYDGSGYFMLKGNEIPLLARIIRIADVFSALTEERTYKASFNKQEALNIMYNEKNYYDPEILEKFINLISNIKKEAIL